MAQTTLTRLEQKHTRLAMGGKIGGPRENE